MKWLYIGCGTLGAVITVAFMMNRTFAYFHKIAEAIGRVDVELNVLLILGGSMGLMLIPVGVGVGLIVAAFINLLMMWFHLGPYSGSNRDGDGSSWVTRRGRRNSPAGTSSQ